jgi:hypothetical protein
MKWFPLNLRFQPGAKPSRTRLAVLLPVQQGDKYDEASGQVYTETSVPISGGDQDWTRLRRVAREERETEHIGYEPAYGAKAEGARASKGARSLQDIAIDATLDYLAGISVEYLKSLPTALLDRIWDEVDQR